MGLAVGVLGREAGGFSLGALSVHETAVNFSDPPGMESAIESAPAQRRGAAAPAAISLRGLCAATTASSRVFRDVSIERRGRGDARRPRPERRRQEHPAADPRDAAAPDLGRGRRCSAPSCRARRGRRAGGSATSATSRCSIASSASARTSSSTPACTRIEVAGAARIDELLAARRPRAPRRRARPQPLRRPAPARRRLPRAARRARAAAARRAALSPRHRRRRADRVADRPGPGPDARARHPRRRARARGGRRGPRPARRRHRRTRRGRRGDAGRARGGERGDLRAARA